MDDDSDNPNEVGSPVMPALAYPSHILFVPPKAFFTISGFWVAIMLATMRPIIFLIGWPPCHLAAVWLYFSDPYFVEVIAAWWASGLWPKWRRTRNVRRSAGNRYIG